MSTQAKDSGVHVVSKPPRLRVAVVSTHVIQHFAPLYRELTRRGEIELRVFYASKAGLSSYRDAGFGVDVAWDSDLASGYQFEFLPRASSTIRQGFLGLRGAGVEEHLDGFEPDVVFLFGYTPAIMLRALVHARRRGWPAVMMSDSELLHDRSVWKRSAKRIVLPRILGQFATFMTIGDNNESYLRHYGAPERKLVRGGYPTDEPAFLDARKNRAAIRSEVRKRWGVADDAFVALLVGKLIDRKRPLDPIAALERVGQRTKRRVHVVVAGDGPLRRATERAANRLPAGSVVFTGFVNQKGLPEVYAAADVLVHPADSDAHPLTITESMLVGLPVVVSDRVGAVGPTDTARPGANALVFPAGDVNHLAEILKRLADDPEELQRMERATDAVARETGLEACVAGFVRAVTRAVDDSTPTGERREP